MDQQFLTELRKIAGDAAVFEQEPMKQHTTFRVGGPADVLLRPRTEQLADVLRLCRQYQIPYQVIGNGSNLLVGDRGIRGLVIELSSGADQITVEGEFVTAQAGALLSKTANCAAQAGLSGMEFAAGIPGSIGGAVVMNAGAYGGEMKDILVSVTVLDADGNEKQVDAEDLALGYRTSNLIQNGYLVTGARLRLTKGDTAQIRDRMNELAQQRISKQPLEYPSAGSTFKRPEGYFAGKLIMDAGLRGYRVGGAQVSEKHCGFVINSGGATAADIVKLMQDVSEKVERQFGVTLEPEVKMVGEFT